MRRRHLLFQAVTVAGMFAFLLATPSTAEARDGCWQCINWGGECPDEQWANNLCFEFCYPAEDAVACGSQPFCDAPRVVLLCADPE